jgi:hypothetical protein
MNRKTLFGAALALLVAQRALAEQAAGPQAALEWLSLVDGGAYAQSWAAAGTIFKAQISASAWAQTIKAAREPLGAASARALTSEVQTATLPGAPAGRYDVLTFKTNFANKPAAGETVVLAKEPSGWRVDGYFIR